jgi:hypothetical protein
MARLKAQTQGTDAALGQGLSGLLNYARRHNIASDYVPLATLTDAELDAKITALPGTRGLSLLLREALQRERTQCQVAQGEQHPA